MRYLIFLFPLFAICQSNSQSAGGFRFYDSNRSNITLYQTIGSRFYHKKYLTSLINGKKVEVRFDAFKDAMYIRFNDNYSEYLLPSKNNVSILLGGKEPWLAYDNKWYRLLFKDKKKSYLFKPIVEYSKPRMANSGYSVNKAAEFKLKKRFFVLEAGTLKKVSKKELKKIGIIKMINSL